jgi:YHS domain-containing protein
MMSIQQKTLAPFALILMLAVAGAGAALQLKSNGRPAPGNTAAQSAGVRKVEVKKVCMVTNRVFEKDQIPVTVQGRTYYGCCEGCKQTLANNPTARAAVDPVSGKTVDKATAVIGARPDGSTLYFENESNLKKYASRPRG